MTKTLMQRLLDAGYPVEEIFHHESDLYVFATQKTKRIISEWYMDEGYTPELFMNPFRDNLTGKMMYDVPFQYLPFWEEKCNGGMKK